MASLVEKETTARERGAWRACSSIATAGNAAADRSVGDLRAGRSLRGRLHRKDLGADTPYNTYTRPGLPPTPIALPGQASIEAA